MEATGSHDTCARDKAFAPLRLDFYDLTRSTRYRECTHSERITTSSELAERCMSFVFQRVCMCVRVLYVHTTRSHCMNCCTECQLVSLQVCVIHEEYLQQMTEGEVDALPSWSAQGSVFEAAKFSDRTVPEQVERFDVEITTEELGLVLKGERFHVLFHFWLQVRILPKTSVSRRYCHCDWH